MRTRTGERGRQLWPLHARWHHVKLENGVKGIIVSSNQPPVNQSVLNVNTP